jgi:thiol:disulfide interchange protein
MATRAGQYPVQVRKASEYLAVAGLGAFSALALSADITTRLAGRLAWHAPGNGAFTSAMALLAMSLGPGFPLLAIGTVVAIVLRRAAP